MPTLIKTDYFQLMTVTTEYKLPLKQNGTTEPAADLPLHLSLAPFHVAPLCTCLNSLR